MKLSGIISFLGAVAVSAAPLAKRASGFRFGGVNLAVGPSRTQCRALIDHSGM
jgi:hypothetical protein